MRFINKKLLYLSIFSLAFSGYAFADESLNYVNAVNMPEPGAKSPDRFELIGALGTALLRASDSQLGVTSSETDSLVQTNGGGWNPNTWRTFAAQGGVGYLHFFRDATRYAKKAQWFPSTEPQVNVYYLGFNDIKGDVWRFTNSGFNQLAYRMPIQSARLMFDLGLTILSKRRLSLYGIAGIGPAWNRVSYNDTDKGNVDCANQVVHLNAKISTNFAWEAGAGLSFILSKRVSVTGQYLYVDLGKGKPSTDGSSGTITAPVIVAPQVALVAHTALLGLHIAL